MKNKLIKLMLLSGSVALLQGCVAFPPLIQVEHKEANPDGNKEVMHRLDAIDHRLNELEQKIEKK